MMKKRLFAFGLAGVMLMGMSMNVFAAEVDNTWNTGTLTTGLGKTSVTGTQAASYTITIPSVIDETAILNEGLSIEGTGNLEPGKSVKVSVGSKSIEMLRQTAGNTPETVGENNFYTLSLSLDGTTALDGELTVGTLNEGATNNKIGTLKATTPTKDNLKAGTYKADITFTIEYK